MISRRQQAVSVWAVAVNWPLASVHIGSLCHRLALEKQTQWHRGAKQIFTRFVRTCQYFLIQLAECATRTKFRSDHRVGTYTTATVVVQMSACVSVWSARYDVGASQKLSWPRRTIETQHIQKLEGLTIGLICADCVIRKFIASRNSRKIAKWNHNRIWRWRW